MCSCILTPVKGASYTIKHTHGWRYSRFQQEEHFVLTSMTVILTDWQTLRCVGGRVYFRLPSLFTSTDLLNDFCRRAATTFRKMYSFQGSVFVSTPRFPCAGVWHLRLTLAGFPPCVTGDQARCVKTRCAAAGASSWVSPALSPPPGRYRLQDLSGQQKWWGLSDWAWLISKLVGFRVSQVRSDPSLFHQFL